MTASRARRFGRLLCVSTIGLAMVLGSPAQAQTTSTVEGQVEGAAPGTVVTLTDINTGHRDTAKIDANGHYLIVGLPPSTYRVESAGKSQTVVVPLGQAVSVDLVSEAPAKSEIVVVGGRTRDVKSTTVTTNISRFQLENLPNGDRNFLNFAALAPGVTVSPPQLGGKARQVQAGGINSDNTNTFIDGISIKNLVNHGGTNGQNYSSGNVFPASAVDQFDVQTQNFKAEYEQAGSAVISSVTKTGGQHFHGEIFGEWQPKAFISENYDDRPGHVNNATPPYRPKLNLDNKFYGGNLGGPIIEDKLTFFVDFEGTKKTFGSTDVNIYPNDITLLPTPAQAYAQNARTKYNGSFPGTFDEKLYFGKLTLFATSADTVNLSAFVRHEANLAVGGNLTTSDASSRIRNNEDRYELNWNHRSDHFLNEFFFARDVAANGSIPNVAGPSDVVTYSGPLGMSNQGNQTLIVLGGTNFSQDDHQYQTLFKDNVTFTGGAHTIKVGAKLNFTKLQRLEDNNGSGTYFYDANTFTGPSTSTPYQATINTAVVAPVTARNTEIGLFAQDDWRPDDHLQVSAGLRWDYESNARNEKFVTPPDVATALRAYPGWRAAGINPEDYISNGHNRKHFFGAFQPRLGVSYDVNGDRSLVFTLGAGRYYDRSLFIDSALETIKDYYETVATVTAAKCGGTLPTDPTMLRACALAAGGGEVHLLNNNTKVPYSDEFDASIRKRVGKINTSITFSYIRSHNIFQEVVGNRLPDGNYSDGDVQLITYNGIPYSRGIFYSGSAIFAAPLPGHGSIFIGNSDGRASYAAVYLQADKPYTEDSGWGFSSTLTISNARTNDTRNSNSIGDPFNFDAPTIGLQGTGPVNALERYRFVGTGTIKVPFDIRLTGILTLSSGPSYGGAVCNVPVKGQPGNFDCYTTNFGIYRDSLIGYRNLDLNVAKTFKLPWGHDLIFSFQALNVLDSVNRNYSQFTGGLQFYNGRPPTFAPDRGGVASQGRNFKVGARYVF